MVKYTRKSFVLEMQDNKNTEYSKVLERFFKTGPGEYGEGDVFWGIKVPVSRKIAQKYSDLDLNDIGILLESKIHEIRFGALCILIKKYRETGNSKKDKKTIVNFYLKNLNRVNNWDLVDGSAPYILGNFLLNKDRSILTRLALSPNLWERRVAVLATFAFIKKGEHEWTFKLADLLLFDQEDLLQKAIGWMLREIGKNCGETILKSFLDKYYEKMPRIMLRYSIERLDTETRKHYLG